jgi:ribose transport system permease protein
MATAGNSGRSRVAWWAASRWGGGKGTALGVAIGVTIVFILDNSLIMLGVPAPLQLVATGIILAGAVMFDTVKQKQKIRA